MSTIITFDPLVAGKIVTRNPIATNVLAVLNGPFTAAAGATITVFGAQFETVAGTATLSNGSVSVALTVSNWTDTQFDAVLPTPTAGADGFRYGEALTLTRTTDSGASTSTQVTITVEAGWSYVNVSTLPAPVESESLQTHVDTPVVNGDQVRFQAITGLTMNSDLTWNNTNSLEYSFQFQFWDATDSTWGDIGLLFVSVNATTLASVAGIVITPQNAEVIYGQVIYVDVAAVTIVGVNLFPTITTSIEVTTGKVVLSGKIADLGLARWTENSPVTTTWE